RSRRVKDSSEPGVPHLHHAIPVGRRARDRAELLAPYKAALFRLQATFTAGMALMVFPNLCAAYHLLVRWLFLRETGCKPTHLDRDLIASEGVHEDCRRRLWSTRG